MLYIYIYNIFRELRVYTLYCISYNIISYHIISYIDGPYIHGKNCAEKLWDLYRKLRWTSKSQPNQKKTWTWYCWWFRNPASTSWRIGTWNLTILLRFNYTSNRWLALGFLNHQQVRQTGPVIIPVIQWSPEAQEAGSCWLNNPNPCEKICYP